MKNKILFSIGVVAVLTLSFTFIDVGPKASKPEVNRASNVRNFAEPVGGFASVEIIK